MKMRPPCTPQHRHVRTRPQGGASEGSKLAPLLVLARNRTPKNIQRPKKKKQKQQRHRVTPLVAQRITLPGNSYFWRTGSLRSAGALQVLVPVPGREICELRRHCPIKAPARGGRLEVGEQSGGAAERIGADGDPTVQVGASQHNDNLPRGAAQVEGELAIHEPSVLDEWRRPDSQQASHVIAHDQIDEIELATDENLAVTLDGHGAGAVVRSGPPVE